MQNIVLIGKGTIAYGLTRKGVFAGKIVTKRSADEFVSYLDTGHLPSDLFVECVGLKWDQVKKVLVHDTPTTHLFHVQANDGSKQIDVNAKNSQDLQEFFRTIHKRLGKDWIESEEYASYMALVFPWLMFSLASGLLTLGGVIMAFQMQAGAYRRNPQPGAREEELRLLEYLATLLGPFGIAILGLTITIFLFVWTMRKNSQRPLFQTIIPE